MRATGLKPSEKDLKKIIESVDVDKNGMLSFPEFQNLLIREVNKSELEALRQEFKSFDTDNDGYITVKETCTALKKQGVKKENINRCVKQMFKGADFDHDDKLTFEG